MWSSALGRHASSHCLLYRRQWSSGSCAL